MLIKCVIISIRICGAREFQLCGQHHSKMHNWAVHPGIRLNPQIPLWVHPTTIYLSSPSKSEFELSTRTCILKNIFSCIYASYIIYVSQIKCLKLQDWLVYKKKPTVNIRIRLANFETNLEFRALRNYLQHPVSQKISDPDTLQVILVIINLKTTILSNSMYYMR